MELVGTRFRHQGRITDEIPGLDCVGIGHALLHKFGQPIFDVEGYKRTPPSSLIIETLAKNFDEIKVDECGVGDMFLIKLGCKPKHLAILVSDTHLIHTLAPGGRGKVVVEPIRQWKPRAVKGFRFRCLQF